MPTGVLLVVAMSARCGAAAAQRFDTVATRVLAPGVVYRHLIAPDGPWSINVVTADLRHPGVRIEALRAHDRLRGRETVRSMVRRHAGDSLRIVAAVNADFFNLKTGENENEQVIDDRIWRAEPLTDAPQEHARSVRSQFAIDAAGRPRIEQFVFHGTVSAPGAPPIRVDAVNVIPDSDAVVWFTPRFGDTLRGDTLPGHDFALPLTPLGARGDTLRFASGPPHRQDAVTIPAGGVLAGFGAAAGAIAALARPDERLTIVTSFAPDRGSLTVLTGGWGRLVEDGRNVGDSTDQWEGTLPSFSVAQHPRTGVGFSRDSNTVVLVTVDGRQESSSGMSLHQFGALMRQLGVFQGMNLDGGGSTTMVVGDSVVNHPSDSGGERAVGSALVVTIRRKSP